jgi:ribosome-binding protein aMBF1 (putative translation factor)
VTQRLNQETLARHLHISESDISELETGRKNIKLVRPVVREKLEEFFELSLAELLAKPKEVEEWVSGTSVGGWML